MKKHVDISIRVPELLCKDINSSKDETSMYSEKRKDPHSDVLDELHKPMIIKNLNGNLNQGRKSMNSYIKMKYINRV